jgi:GNAT superfamily N-acetyltransferase
MTDAQQSVFSMTMRLGDALMERYPGLRLELSSRDRTSDGVRTGHITIHEISLPADQRGQGIGSEVMRELCDLADREGLQLALTPDTVYGASSVSRLVSFYRGLGFSANSGRKRDYEISESMRREPRVRPELTQMADRPEPASVSDQPAASLDL